MKIKTQENIAVTLTVLFCVAVLALALWLSPEDSNRTLYHGVWIGSDKP